MKRFAVASLSIALLIVAPGSVVRGAHAPPAGCVAADLGGFQEVVNHGPLATFPGWESATGYALDRLPPRPTALAVRAGVACDLTTGLAAFLGGAPAVDPAPEAALLALRSVHADVFPDATAVDAPVVLGDAVAFTAWTPRNGVLARVLVSFSNGVDVSFSVLDRAVGPFVPAIEGWNLLPGDTERTVAGDSPLDAIPSTKVIYGTNVDGTQWRVTYYPPRYSSEAEADRHAQMHMRGALLAYAEGYGWGFRSADPDRVLDLTLDGCDCIYGGYQANVHMFPRANDILALLPGLAYRDEAELAQLIVGHELFHHFQYGIQQWRMGSWMTEGQARFSETVNVPDYTFLPTTLTYWEQYDNGMNGFLANPNRGVGSHSYDFSIVWGYLQAANGGMALVKAVLEESRVGGTNPDTDGVAAIDRALARFPARRHATFADAYVDFAKATFTHDGFTWGKADGTQAHDWSTHFRPTARSNNTMQGSIATWGFVFLDLGAAPVGIGGGGGHGGGGAPPPIGGLATPAAPFVSPAAAAAVVADDANTYSRLLTESFVDGSFASVDLAPSGTAAAVADGVVALVRANREFGPENPLPSPGSNSFRAVFVT